jgi:hypothetical protein
MAQWEQLIDHPNYEICIEYPHEIRNASTHHVLKPKTDKDGYVLYGLGRDRYRHHRLIACQWIDNPDGLPCIDHIDRNPSNNHIENLRWVNYSTNNRNRSCETHTGYEYEWVNELPDDALVVDTYGEWHFENYHYAVSTDRFYYFNDTQYRILKINEQSHGGALSVWLRDIEGHLRWINIPKFKRIYNIIMT